MTKPGRPRVYELTDPSAKLIRDFRDKYELNTEQAGEVLGIPRRTIENIEHGRGFRYPRLLELAIRNIKKRDVSD